MGNKLNPLFSIVIVNYNSGKYIEEAILSVLNQDCNDYELLLIDGGSDDNSIEIIKKYKDKFSYWISEKDAGQSDAFNKGFANAKGEFFFWLNADDILQSNSLRFAKDYLNKNPKCLWLTFNTVVIDETDKIIRFINGPKWNNYIMNNYWPQIDSATSIFHNTIYDKTSGFDLRFHYAMDIDLWLQFINLGIKYKRLNYYFYGFRVHSQSKTTNQGYKTKPNRERLLQNAIIRNKNNFEPKKIAFFLAMLNKAVFCKPISIYNTLKWKNKEFSEIDQLIIKKNEK